MGFEIDGHSVAQWARIASQESSAMSQIRSVAARQSLFAQYTGQQQLTDTLAQWSRAAPTAPAGALLAAAQANIAPDSDVGQWIVKNAVPALSLGTYSTGQAVSNQPALDFLADPLNIEALQGMSVDDATAHLQSGGFANFRAPVQQLGTTGDLGSALAGGLNAQGQQAEQAGIGDVGQIADAAKTATRVAGTVAQSGAETIGGAIRLQAAGLAQSVANVAHGESPTAHKTATGVPLDPQAYTIPKFQIPSIADIPGLNSIPGVKESPFTQGFKAGGSTVTFGGEQALTDLGQITGVQALRGESTGTGFFPAGPAHEKAALAQRAAASVNGHAFTPGRAFASLVTEPDTFASSLASGLVDMQVALNGDPAFILTNEISDARKASKLFAPTTDDAITLASQAIFDQSEDPAALRAWTGVSAADEPDIVQAIANKVKADPGSISGAPGVNPKTIMRAVGSPYVGVFKGLRTYLHQPTALEYLNSDAGSELVDKIRQNGFTQLRQWLGKDVPVDYLAQLAKSNDSAEIRSLLGEGLGTSIRHTPDTGFDFGYDPTARWSQFMPTGSVSHLDLNNAIEQSERTLAEVGVPKEKWDGILTKIASAQGRADFFTAYVDGVGNAVAQQLKEVEGLSDARARGLTKFWANSHGYDGKFWLDEIGNTPYVSGLTLDGEAVPMNGPTLGAELTDHIPTLNARDLKRAASKMGKLFELQDSENIAARALGKGVTAVDYAASGYTNAFKVGALARLGLPIRIVAEAQARMATGGLSSMFSHPLDFINWTIGHTGEADLEGEKFLDMLGDQSSSFGRAVGRNSYVNETSVFDAESQMAKHWVPVQRGDVQHAAGWADELSKLHMDPVSQQVAKAMSDPANYTAPGVEDAAGLDAAKSWFSDGAGQKFRNDLIDARLKWGSVNLDNKLVADNYIDKVIVPRIEQATAGDPTLLDAVANGTPFGPEGIGTDLLGNLRDMANAGQGPEFVKGMVPLGKGKLRLFSNMIDRWFSSLVDRPYSELAKSPAYRQFYWQEGQRLLPFMTEEAQDAVIDAARTSEIKLTKPAVSGALDLEGAQKLTNIRAISDSQRMLHIVSERNNLADTLRYVAPFGDAWRNVVTQWVHLASENPQIGRRVQQGVQEMRSSGFFYNQTDPNDPTKHNEVFTLVPGAAVKALTGVDFKMTAPVKGLNLASQGLPGIGPALTLPASLVLPKDNPISNAVREKLMPYGAPDFTGGVVESLFPGWADKLRAGGWLGPIGATADQKVTLQDLAKQVFSYKASTGTYDLSDPNVLAKVSADSLDAAKRLYLLRGLAQFGSPSAPNYVPRVLADKKTAKLADGGYIETWRLANDYQTMVKANKNDSYAATLQFINKYGPNYIFATQAENRRLVYGVPVTADGLAFKYAHPDVVRDFPNTYGFFAPQTGPFDYNAYLDAIHNGTIQPLSVQTWAELANQRLGNAVYANLRSRLGASPDANQRNWLNDQKAAIAKEFPGFNDESLKVSRQNLDGPGGTIDELQRAIKDPTLQGQPLSHAVAVYLELRNRALAVARERTGKQTTTLGGNAMADLRGWLYQNGTIIATQIPEFTTMWDYLFTNEVAPPADTATTTSAVNG